MLGVLATFSTIGFLVFFALPALMAVAWDLIRRTTELERLSEFYIRFVCVFTGRRVFITFVILSIMSLISGLLCLLYYVAPIELFISFALLLEIITFATAIGAILCIYIATGRVSIDDIRKLAEYTTYKKPKKGIKKQ